ncbi:hypothetical protein SDC9_128940 [bioreactor metagenome]|uniref:Uncharacterized protein n=1 Tax=bioreactor metagenome TaxID=1076179 RepID=A0A645CYC7_9ZZZZ
MKRITLKVNDLLEKLLAISDEKMDYVVLSFIDYEVDQKRIFPAFLHFLGISKEGYYKDYESIDTVSKAMTSFISGLSA